VTLGSIDSIFAWEAFDSRGNPTLACSVLLSDGIEGSVVVPAGVSKGQHEVPELRDGGMRFKGLGVRTSVDAINKRLGTALRGVRPQGFRELDARLVELDRSDTESSVGGNGTLGVSLAFAVAHARSERVPLFEYLGEGQPPLLPLPMVNVLSGGLHAHGALDIQDVLVIPVRAANFPLAIEWAWMVRFAAEELAVRMGEPAHLVADEGGIGARMPSNRAALELVDAAITRAGLRPGEDVWIAVDLAANQLRSGQAYRFALEDRTISSDELTETIVGWCKSFPIVSIEDPFAEEDAASWQRLTSLCGGRLQIIGDDLFVTQTARIEQGSAAGTGNAVLIKANQVGTLSGALDATNAAKRLGFTTITSGRSGDTEDSWLADLSVGSASGQVKVGSLTRSERTSKWNRLLRLASQFEMDYAGSRPLARFLNHGMNRDDSPRPDPAAPEETSVVALADLDE
jgi:enolase